MSGINPLIRTLSCIFVRNSITIILLLHQFDLLIHEFPEFELESKNEFGDNPFLTAVFNSSLDFIEKTLHKGLYRCSSSDAEDNNSIVAAAANNNLPILKLLFRFATKKDIHSKSKLIRHQTSNCHSQSSL